MFVWLVTLRRIIRRRRCVFSGSSWADIGGRVLLPSYLECLRHVGILVCRHPQERERELGKEGRELPSHIRFREGPIGVV